MLGEYAISGDCIDGLGAPTLSGGGGKIVTVEMTVSPRWELSLAGEPRYVAELDGGLDPVER